MPVKKKERTDKLCGLTEKEKGKFDTLKQEIENLGKKSPLCSGEGRKMRIALLKNLMMIHYRKF
ncbi:hypothetical protein J4T77_03410 [Wolbachia endosymbiont of Drosophila innubila]|uniref:hypothetical protein n=1 Tax=Wolbachia endosymbiont of Drosophila innubila TaxID=282263 RepID=UPI001F30C69F|nr:hypothetical protein [Wolbachia endosymbiont of Drosophila innubila]UID80840.1 hypothetical protein J4T77_03410 [Wolbachia endosymbiont of Drosophila innubila]